ncbi:MAG: hypothetical protein KGK07_08460 [Chloroflexota bacterium]|nr:hypothetical protein [Chloroflexota bacterium]
MTAPSLEQAKERMLEAAEEQEYWDRHYDEVLAKYPDQFVAVKDGVVVGAESDLAQLIFVLSTRHIDIRDTWVRFVTEDHSKLLL